MALTEAEQKELEYLLHLEYLDQVKTDYAKYVEYVHDGLYQHANHTKFLCAAVQEAIDNRKKMLAGEMKKEVQYISLSIPPRHGKSMTITETAASFFLGNFPNDRVIIAGYGQDLATDFSKKNKDKVVQFGQELFGIKLKDGTTASTDWDIARVDGKMLRGGCIARGILSGVTGKGADLLIIDDPIKTREEADSEVTRNKIWGEWVDSFSTRLHPAAIVIVIMTRWHENDLIGRFSDNDYGTPLPWKHINLPLEAEEGDLMGREVGAALWPERYDKDFIETRKKISAQSFNALFQGRPTAQEGNLIKREWWKKFDTPPKMPRIIMSVDATFKDSDDSDYVAIQCWGKSGVNAYLLGRIKQRMDFPATIKAIINMKREMARKNYDVSGIFIEDKANGSAIISMLRNQIAGIIAVNPKGGKVARVNAISAYIQAGNVWLPKEPWVEEYIEEWAAFPKGKNDDEVDCTSQALNQLFYYEAELPEPDKPQIPWVFQQNVEESEDYISWD